MDEIEEARARKAFQEAVAEFQRLTAQPGTGFSERWLAAVRASEEAEKIADHWEEQHTAWFTKANEVVPDDSGE
jgi:hypothetical protein